MLVTCNYADHMSKMIQIRNVPDQLHRTLKVRAASSGMSLSDYLLVEVRQVAERPTLDEFRHRLNSRPPSDPRPFPADEIRRERERR